MSYLQQKQKVDSGTVPSGRRGHIPEGMKSQPCQLIPANRYPITCIGCNPFESQWLGYKLLYSAWLYYILKSKLVLNAKPYLAPKMSFLARSIPETTFTLRIRDSSCEEKRKKKLTCLLIKIPVAFEEVISPFPEHLKTWKSLLTVSAQFSSPGLNYEGKTL